jgi:hypothetical protein
MAGCKVLGATEKNACQETMSTRLPGRDYQGLACPLQPAAGGGGGLGAGGVAGRGTGSGIRVVPVFARQGRVERRFEEFESERV